MSMNSDVTLSFRRTLDDIQEESTKKRKRSSDRSLLNEDSVDRVEQLSKKNIPRQSSTVVTQGRPTHKAKQSSKTTIYYCEKVKLLSESIESKLEEKHLTAEGAEKIVSKLLRESKAIAKAEQKKDTSLVTSYLLNPISHFVGNETDDSRILKAKLQCTDIAEKSFERIIKELSEITHDNIKDKKKLSTLVSQIRPLVSDEKYKNIIEKYAEQTKRINSIELQLFYLKNLKQKLVMMNPELIQERQEICQEIIEYCKDHELHSDLAFLFADEEFRSIINADQIVEIEEILDICEDEKIDSIDLTSFSDDTVEILSEIGSTNDEFSFPAQIYLNRIIGNKEFNKAAVAYRKLNKEILEDEVKEGLSIVIELSYKLDNQKTELLESASKKIEHIFSILSQKVEIPSTEEIKEFTSSDEDKKNFEKIVIDQNYKLTPREIGCLASLRNMQNTISTLKDLCPEHSSIGETFSKYAELISKYQVLSLFVNMTTDYQDGDLSFDNKKISNKVHGKESTWKQLGQKIATLTSYDHGATIIKGEKDGNCFAHVMGNFYTEKISLDQFCYQDTYRLNWSKLITEQGAKELEKILPEITKQEKFKEISSPADLLKKLYQDEFKKLIRENEKEWSGNHFINPESRRKDSVRHLKQTHKSKSVDNMDTFEDFSHIKQSLDGTPEGKKEIFCTEFQAKVTALTAWNVRKQAYELIKQYNPTAKITEKGVSKLPIKDKTKFSAMHAGRVYGDISKFSDFIPKSPLFYAIVDVNK